MEPKLHCQGAEGVKAKSPQKGTGSIPGGKIGPSCEKFGVKKKNSCEREGNRVSRPGGYKNAALNTGRGRLNGKKGAGTT